MTVSDQPPPPTGGSEPSSRGDAKRAAKADAAASKARAKAERPWFKKKRVILPLGLLLIIVIVVATSGGDDDGAAPVAGGDGSEAAGEPQATDDGDAPDGDDDADGSDEATTTGIGSPAADGRFEFTVSSFECGETSVGEEFFEEDAQGQFCLMEVRVQNIGDSSQMFSASEQYVFNEEGTQYSASFEATFANNPSGDELFTDINPGNAVEGTIVFDVPEGAEIAYAELHDSPFSGGVRVELR